jgi:GAF domain-containing protein
MDTLLKLGKAVVSITNQQQLFQRILDGAMDLSGSDVGWLLVYDEKSKNFLLAAQQNLPAGWARKIGEPLDDGVSSLVRVSGEPLLMHGKSLDRFKVASLGRAIAIIPIKAKNDVIGLLIVMRRKELPYTPNTQMLLEGVADYAAVSMVNARLFKALEETALMARKGEEVKQGILKNLRKQIRDDIQAAIYPLEVMESGKLGTLTDKQREALERARVALEHIIEMVNQATLRFGKG